MSPSPNINFYERYTPDIRDVVLKDGMTYENVEIKLSKVSSNGDGSFNIHILIKE